MPKIILKFESAVIKEFPFTTNALTIGRKPDNDVPIDHPAVSGHHCKILLQGDTYFVEDLNSTNGTLVNEKKIIKAGIHNQDVITIAKHSLVFVDDRPISAHEIAQMSQQAEASAAESPVPAPAAAPVSAAQPAPPASRASLDKIGSLRVMDGVVDETDFTLKENSTYIGKSDRVTVKIKGGMFAPDVAAMISRKADGYVLVAIKEGYPKVNGIALKGERPLNEGDLIEVGDTKIQFYLKSSS